MFLEIEAPNKSLVEKYAKQLKLDIKEAWFGTIGHVYEKVLNRDIKKEKRLVFKKGK